MWLLSIRLTTHYVHSRHSWCVHETHIFNVTSNAYGPDILVCIGPIDLQTISVKIIEILKQHIPIHYALSMPLFVHFHVSLVHLTKKCWPF